MGFWPAGLHSVAFRLSLVPSWLPKSDNRCDAVLYFHTCLSHVTCNQQTNHTIQLQQHSMM